jgi:hypothetical protein
MTTIVADRESMAADKFVTYTPCFNGERKIWVARGSIWGAAGPSWKGLAFKAWTFGKGKRPTFLKEDEEESNEVKLEVLQLSPDGLFLWVNGDLPDPVMEPFFGIGSGGQYAVGALTKGSTLVESIEIAARWDSGTRLPIDMISLGEIGKRKAKATK